MVFVGLLALFLASKSSLQAQEEHICGADALLQERLDRFGISLEEHESHLQEDIIKNRQKAIASNAAIDEARILTIPVVIHLIYDVALDVSSTLLSDGIPRTPRETVEWLELNWANKINAYFEQNSIPSDVEKKYKDVLSGDTRIRFKLAKRNEYGFPTNGIVVVGTTFEKNDEGEIPQFSYTGYELKNLSKLWDTQKYLNVYIVPKKTIDFHGSSTFPSVNLDGWHAGYTNPKNANNDFRLKPTSVFDGYMIRSTHVATSTEPHEIGHYLSLLHPFQGQCIYGDFCKDTPEEQRSSITNACNDAAKQFPCDPRKPVQIENFMGYGGYSQGGPDCQSIFTLCQYTRMRQTLMYGRHRTTLFDHPEVLEELPERENDLIILNNIPNGLQICDQRWGTDVQLGNGGTNRIENAVLEWYVDGELLTEQAISHPIESYSTSIAFFSLNFPADLPIGAHTVTVRVVEVNGTDDSYAPNNIFSIEAFKLPKKEIETPFFTEDFEDPATQQWYITEPTGLTRVISTETSHKKVLAIQMEDSEPQYEHKIISIHSPTLDFRKLASDETAELSFRYHYRINPRRTQAQLSVFGSTPSTCEHYGSEFGHPLYFITGVDLNTVINQNVGDPDIENGWKHIVFKIPRINKQSAYRIRIAIANGRSGTLYIDDIAIKKVPEKAKELTIMNISIAEVGCGVAKMYFDAQNGGTESLTITDEQSPNYGGTPTIIHMNISGRDPANNKLITFVLPYFAEKDIQIGKYPFHTPGLRKGTFYKDNGQLKGLNSIYTYITDTASVREFPHRDNRQQALLSSWQFASSFDGEKEWHNVANDLGNLHIKAPIFNNPKAKRGTFFKLVSPLYDLSALSKEQGSALSFDLSYGYNKVFSAVDRLQILVFEDCESIPTEVIYERRGENLGTNGTLDGSVPVQSAQWRKEVVDLSSYVGKKVLLMFVATSGEGNDIFLDNIEVHDTKSPTLTPIDYHDPQKNVVNIFPNPIITEEPFSVNFNLPEVQNVALSLVNTTGQVIWKQDYPKVGSSIHSIRAPLQAGKIYLLRLEGETVEDVTRIVTK